MFALKSKKKKKQKVYDKSFKLSAKIGLRKSAGGIRTFEIKHPVTK